MKQIEEFAYLGSVDSSNGRIFKNNDRSRIGATRSFGTKTETAGADRNQP